jgi:hypothetical protein
VAYSGICLETEENHKKSSLRLAGLRGQDLKPVPAEYDAGVVNHSTTTFGEVITSITVCSVVHFTTLFQ